MYVITLKRKNKYFEYLCCNCQVPLVHKQYGHSTIAIEVVKRDCLIYNCKTLHGVLFWFTKINVSSVYSWEKYICAVNVNWDMFMYCLL